jgi:hypothetical protein
MFPLYGTAMAARGFDSIESRQVLRLQSPKEGPEQLADFALVRQPQDFDAAVSSGALVIGDCGASLSHSGGLPLMIQLSTKFNYLGHGDILGFHSGSRRFRTLYRRSSAP